MKTEYLITFDPKQCMCTDEKKFRSLLSSHDLISMEDNKIIYKGKTYDYQLAQGSLPDSSKYYDLTIECSSNTEDDMDTFKSCLRDIRSICTKLSGREIIILNDGLGEEYCILGYPKIYRTENLMRKLISKFMAISIGYNWHDSNIPKEVLESVRGQSKKEKTNFLHEVDFIQLSNFLFKKYTKSDANAFFDGIKKMDDNETITYKEVKYYAHFTNWEKYFSEKVQCESEYLRTKWEKLYDYRCKIAHCRGITKDELDDLSIISDDICQKIQSALDSISDLHIEDIEREELAENISGVAIKGSSELIYMFSKLENTISSACERSIESNNYEKEKNILGESMNAQTLFLYNKGLITEETLNKISSTAKIRNIIVHGMPSMIISDDDISYMSKVIIELISDVSLINNKTISLKKQK